MSAPTHDEALVLWFMQNLERGYGTDIKTILDPKFHAAFDSAVAKGYIEQAWVLTEAGTKEADQAWKAHTKAQDARLREFKIGRR